MKNLNNPSSRFLCKVRNQVLKNQILGNIPKYHVFAKLSNSKCQLLGGTKVFGSLYCRKDTTGLILMHYGPKNYVWKRNTKYYLMFDSDHILKTAFVIPRDWLLHYDPEISILQESPSGYSTCYLDLEKGKWAYSSKEYLIRDRFHLDKSEEEKPYSIRKGDEDWCITHLDLDPPFIYYFNFYSFLLIKNIDFSEFDLQVEAKGLKCPFYYDQGIKLKDKSKHRLVYSIYQDMETPCICVDCRKDYRAIEISVHLNEDTVGFEFSIPIK